MADIPRLKAVTSIDEVRPQKRVPEMIRVPADRPITGIILCNAPYHMPTHFDGKLTRLCPGEGSCELCTKCSLRNYYLVALYDRNSGLVYWVQLTDHATASLMKQLRELERPFYGAVVKVGRERKSMQSPVTVSVDQWSQPHGKLPRPMEPTDTIERVFNSPKSNRPRRGGKV